MKTTSNKKDKTTDAEKINAVKTFILDTHNARGRSTTKLFERDIPREMRWSKFVAILSSNKIRKFDKEQMEIETGETVSNAEMEWNRLGIVEELIEGGAKKLCAEEEGDVFERAVKARRWLN